MSCRVRYLFSIFIFCFALAGCTAAVEDVVDDGNVDAGTSDCPLGGAAVKGLINAATVTVYTVDATGTNETSVGAATTDSSGAWSAAPKPCADDGLYRVEVTDGTYTSEATKNSVTNTVAYTALIDTASVDLTGSAESLAITPVSTFIDERASGILALSKAGNGKGRYAAVTTLAEAIATATTEVKAHFGLTKNPLLIDVNFDNPDEVTSNPEGTLLGLILGAMTEQAKDFADPGNFIQALISDFADGKFDGIDAAGAAITVSDPTAGDAPLAVDAGTSGFTDALDDYTTGTDNVFADSGITLADVTDIIADVTTGVAATIAASDTTAPTVSSKSPTADTTGVAITTTVTATFSEAMDDATITDTNFTLTQGTTAVAGTVTYDSATMTATFAPSESLSQLVEFTATLTTGNTDTVGNSLAETTWKFTTENAVPTVASKSPTADAKGVFSGATVTATFSEAMDSATVIAANFTVLQAGTPVAGAVTYDATTKTATFTPSSPIEGSKVYTATLTTAITDSVGTALEKTVWSFTGGLVGGEIQGVELSLTNTVSTFAGTLTDVSGFANGTGTAARFKYPYGIATDGTNLYVSDTGNHTIRKIVISTGEVTTLAGSEDPNVFGVANGTGTGATFASPRGLATDGTYLWVVDRDGHNIRQIVLATGVVTSFAGVANSSGFLDATGTSAQFFFPTGITTDGTNLYIGDSSNHRIRKIVISTGVVTTFAGDGTPALLDGTGGAAQFNIPFGITTDGTNLYVADSMNNAIRQIVISTQVVTTLAGGTSGNADGIGASAQFASPFGITTDGTNLYVSENFSVRKVVIATGEVTTIAGGVGSGHVDGDSTVAAFNSLTGITTDGKSLFLTELTYHDVRKIE